MGTPASANEQPLRVLLRGGAGKPGAPGSPLNTPKNGDCVSTALQAGAPEIIAGLRAGIWPAVRNGPC